ncbi:hypothetical protein GPJ56_006117 [Histomonas meleagridis]|uniref:uncharacterized protein n=1 Tax=Histomonas meleagridis TaxID=135588 RepID=UPI00355A40C0|nr:hypothetical protein GPJ56_006117 [Histomonas meleagridis]KAH0804031.1 hypothetical protein GO595_002861 [Histomonas meleagridis]
MWGGSFGQSSTSSWGNPSPSRPSTSACPTSGSSFVGGNQKSNSNSSNKSQETHVPSTPSQSSKPQAQPELANTGVASNIDEEEEKQEYENPVIIIQQVPYPVYYPQPMCSPFTGFNMPMFSYPYQQCYPMCYGQQFLPQMQMAPFCQSPQQQTKS